MKKRKTKAHAERAWATAIIGLAVLAVIATTIKVLVIHFEEQASRYDYTETTSYTVSSGETLWWIAKEYSDERHDVREVIDDIRELSNTTASIEAGQRLTIPLYDCMKDE